MSEIEISEEELKEKSAVKGPYYCYIVYDKFGNTYNGFTNNLERRIKQHNSILKGGAKYTTRKSSKYIDNTEYWKYLITVTSSDKTLFTYKKALSLEWSIKFPDNKRPRPAIYNNPIGRINGLSLVFQNPKFSDICFTVTIHSEEYKEQITKVLSEIFNIAFA